jgi:hypothetical protein
MPGGVAEDNPAPGGIHVGRRDRGRGDPGQAVVGAQGGQGLGHAEDAAAAWALAPASATPGRHVVRWNPGNRRLDAE